MKKLILYKHYGRFTVSGLIALFLFAGCSTVNTAVMTETPQIINVKNELTVHLYDSATALRSAYMYQGGDAGKINKVLGFYSESDNAIHCLKWDFYSCGHELFHALKFKGAPTLVVDKGYEHFDSSNYTLVEH